MKRLAIPLVLLALVLALVFAFRTIGLGTWAELELVSIQAVRDGRITAEFAVRYPNGGGLDFTSYIDGQPQGGGGVGGRGILPLPKNDSKVVEFDLNPERSSVEGSFTNSTLYSRLLVRVGERHRIHTGKPLNLYDFSVGKHHYRMVAACEGDHSAAPREQFPTPEQAAQFFKAILEEAGKGNDQFAALDAARRTAPYLSELVRLFPQAEVNYRYFGGGNGPGFDVGVDLHERYEFQMQLPVDFDSLHRSVTGYGEPQFYLREIERVETQKKRTGVSWYNPAGERRFGSAEWKKIAESGGDFSAIGYPMITNRPVAGFKDRKIEK